jgi:hypothetical protein
MSAIGISLGLLIAVFAILLLYNIRRLQPQVTGYGLQSEVLDCQKSEARMKEMSDASCRENSWLVVGFRER